MGPAEVGENMDARDRPDGGENRKNRHKENEGGRSGEGYVSAARYLNLAISFGLTLTVTMLLGFYGGRWLDGRVGSFPLFALSGMLVAIGLSFKSLLDELNVLTGRGKKR
ncbi:MAG: AtpZ/AtpI family protein [Clostridia bacterium]|nr:MAG: AtpZ/AtpI family protein [Clostridia bacterium]